MKSPLIVANWKMNHTIEESLKYLAHFKKALILTAKTEIVLCPPFTALSPLAMAMQESEFTLVKLGAQNCHYETEGAYTGEVSPSFLKEVGCEYVLAGHSERRHVFGESNEFIGKKVAAVLEQEMTPILCVGETLAQRSSGKTMEVIIQQLEAGLSSLKKENWGNFVVAYEPVWAIGTGQNATPEQANEVHIAIRQWLAQRTSEETAKAVRLLYGGSVKPENAHHLLKQSHVNGLLVGGASLTVDSFLKIVNDA